MTSETLWWMLLAFTLGFAASTLWEWLYFRQHRRLDAAERIADLEEQLQQARRTSSLSPPAHGPSRSESAPPSAADETPATESGAAEFTSSAVLLANEQQLASTSSTAQAPPAARNETAADLIQPFTGIPAAQSDEPGERPAADEALQTQPAQAPSPESPVSPVPPPRPASAHPLAAETPPPHEEPSPAPAAEPETEQAVPCPDNLTRIAGIGKRYKERLYAAGIFTWHQLAETSTEELRAITRAQPNADITGWIENARKLAQQHGRTGAVYHGPIPDDFTEIRGIGPATMQALYNAGIYTYAQLAQTSVERLSQVFPAPSIGDGFDFESWIRAAAERVHTRQS